MNKAKAAYQSHAENIEAQISRFLPLVNRLASNIARRLPATISLEDLVQEGLIGLMDALKKYPPGSHENFERYAVVRIRGSIYDACRKNDLIPRHQRDRIDKISAAVKKLDQHLGRPATEREIADSLGMSLGEYQSLLGSAVTFSSLEGIEDWAQIASTEDEKDEPLGTQARQRITDAVKELPEKQKIVLSLHYERYMSYREIAAVLNLTPGRIAQLHSEAMVRIRAKLANSGEAS